MSKTNKRATKLAQKNTFCSSTTDSHYMIQTPATCSNKCEFVSAVT